MRPVMLANWLIQKAKEGPALGNLTPMTHLSLAAITIACVWYFVVEVGFGALQTWFLLGAAGYHLALYIWQIAVWRHNAKIDRKKVRTGIVPGSRTKIV